MSQKLKYYTNLINQVYQVVKCINIRVVVKINNRLLTVVPVLPTMKYLHIYFVLVGFSSIVDVYSLTSDLLPTTEVCGISEGSGTDIEGIVKTSINEYPWLVLLKFEQPNGGGFYCGGSLINNRYVLTAAHCIKKIPSSWNLVSVRLGDYNIETSPDCVKINDIDTCAPGVIDIAIDETIIHEEYNSRAQLNDIALLRLEKTVEFTDYIKPICIPTSDSILSQNLTGTNMVVAGWGRTPNNVENNIKVKIGMLAQSNEECAKRYKGKSTIGSGHLCAGVGGNDMCNGGGGNPLMAKVEENDKSSWYASGVVSFGVSPCGLGDWPSVYTRVTEYVPWIISKLRS